jgi:hypothetical protein
MEPETNAVSTADPTPAAPAESPKPKAPRRASTKSAAALRIAGAHPDPKALIRLMDAGAQSRELIAGEAAQIAEDETRLAEWRTGHRERKQFAEEIDGLDPTTLIGVRAVLVSRAGK